MPFCNILFLKKPNEENRQRNNKPLSDFCSVGAISMKQVSLKEVIKQIFTPYCTQTPPCSLSDNLYFLVSNSLDNVIYSVVNQCNPVNTICNQEIDIECSLKYDCPMFEKSTAHSRRFCPFQNHCSLQFTCLNWSTQLDMQNVEDIRDIFQFEGTFCQKLVGLHTRPSVFGKFSVHAWRYCGGLNKEKSISVH